MCWIAWDILSIQSRYLLANQIRVEASTYSGRSDNGHIFLPGKLDELLGLVFRNPLGNDGDGPELEGGGRREEGGGRKEEEEGGGRREEGGGRREEGGGTTVSSL